MYTGFFGLREKPFSLAPDPRYLFLSASHREALAHLLYGIEEGEGFIEVIGQVGTGKTTLCRTLLDRIGSDAEIAYIFNPSPSEVELLAAINREFGLPTARAHAHGSARRAEPVSRREERRRTARAAGDRRGAEPGPRGARARCGCSPTWRPIARSSCRSC